jgi:rRNA processing protein Gar1
MLIEKGKISPDGATPPLVARSVFALGVVAAVIGPYAGPFRAIFVCDSEFYQRSTTPFF